MNDRDQDTSGHERDVVDAHHHLWRREDLSWLSGPVVPRIFGPYEPIRRDYLADEFVADASGCRVTASVYVQANWPLDRSVDEVRWVHAVHERTGWPTAIVGSADLFDLDAPGILHRQRAVTSLMRGIRLQLHWHERPEFAYASAPDRMHDPVFRRNIAALQELGWLFELQVFPSQMGDATRLVAAFPQVTFVLVHAGMLESLNEQHVSPWCAGMARLAEQPNLVVKLSGQGTFVHRVDAEFISFVAQSCLGWFGSERCMWGSNFPVEKIWTDYQTLMSTWQSALSGEPETVRRNVFSATARRIYAL